MFIPKKLGDVLRLHRGYDITKTQQSPGPYPVVSSSGVSSFHSDYKFHGPGVVIGRKGSLGTAFYIRGPYWPHDTTLYVEDFQGNIPRYCYYLLKTLGLERYDVGAANPTLNRNHLHELDVLVPALFQQERIASILSAYDDLIENNTRRIAILEEMARRIFDFDMEHTPDNSAAYPETPVMSVIDVTLGGDWGADAASGEETNNVRIIRGTDFRRIEAGDFSTVPSRFVSGTSLKRRRLRAFDLVVENSINAKTRAAGTPLLINSGVLRALEGPAIATSFCRQFRCKTFAEGVFLFHYLRWLRRRRLIEEFQVIAANGIANFQTEQFLSRASIPLAGEEIRQIGGKLMQFDPTVLRAQISNLRAQRDLLLPKLVSGDIDVSAIGASLKEAAE